MPLILFWLGLLNGFSLDHLVAVSAMVGQERSMARGSWTGFRFGLAHLVALTLFGIGASLLGLTLQPAWERAAEAVGGLFLVGVGLWILKDLVARREAPSQPKDSPVHLEEAHPHIHLHKAYPPALGGRRHLVLMVGGLFGICGLRSLVLMVPVLLAGNLLASLGYILLFGLGTLLALTLYGLVLSRVFNVMRRRTAIATVVTSLTGLLSIGLGVYLMARG